MPGKEGGKPEPEHQSEERTTIQRGAAHGSALRYRQHRQQTVIVGVLMYYLQPKVSVDIQEVIIIFVPEEMR